MDTNLVRWFVCEDESGNIKLKCNYCDAMFVELDKFRKHISKMKCRTKITHLYDECLTKIFQFLAPNDLVNVRAVCKQFKIIAERVFYLHCHPGPIKICTQLKKKFRSKYDYFAYRDSRIRNFIRMFIPLIKEEKKIDVYVNAKSRYEAYFTSLIRRVTVYGIISIPGQRNEFTFIKKNCAKNLISLALYGERLFENNRKIHGAIIQNQIKDLQQLQLVNVPMQDLYENLLQYCNKNLKKLHIFCLYPFTGSIPEFVQPIRSINQFDDAWAEHRYPKLEWIFLQTPNDTFDLLPLIRRNENVRNIACNSLTTIRSICRADIELKFIAMIFFKLEDYIEVERDIVIFGRRKNFDKFELSFIDSADEPVARITNVPNVTGLHLFVSTILMVLVKKNVHLPLIEKLCIFNDYYPRGYLDENELRQIDDCFPNVREIRFRTAGVPVDYSKFLMKNMFVYPPIFRNLTEITFENDEISEFSLDDFEQMNRSRLTTSKVEIYLDPAVFHKFNENIIDMGMIVIKPWVHGRCEICMHPNFDDINIILTGDQ